VNKRVVGDFNISEQNGGQNETKSGKRIRPTTLFRRRKGLQKSFNPQNSNPESKPTKQTHFSLKFLCFFQGHAYYGEYPLAFAAAFGHMEIYDYLIDHGADPNMQDSYGNTVLHVLVIRDRMVGAIVGNNQSCSIS